eukprot:scaffold85098_cov20-Tisochrysis_lutea.AAC.1
MHEANHQEKERKGKITPAKKRKGKTAPAKNRKGKTTPAKKCPTTQHGCHERQAAPCSPKPQDKELPDVGAPPHSPVGIKVLLNFKLKAPWVTRSSGPHLKGTPLHSPVCGGSLAANQLIQDGGACPLMPPHERSLLPLICIRLQGGGSNRECQNVGNEAHRRTKGKIQCREHGHAMFLAETLPTPEYPELLRSVSISKSLPPFESEPRCPCVQSLTCCSMEGVHITNR